ncbi:hypothetical protein A2368_01915 [Candidatus Collierbacteria bacterium RIFOXYB1_FULL_49_13]|uniref:Glycosyl transferase family 1 domain-containing protein n=1 Tax=Candidatus Collierbacteria bacterium RIFOXYB1_FULL_49_13 TaxID=1817728 RepID=A0A1F5FGH5_9BACT|nr:MAG: hypothetical protein A2368_01915 [Candidatus Collierbacteria bacterium RIFOXYB1_FULL_49_13]
MGIIQTMRSICYTHKDIADVGRGGLSTLFKTLATGLAKNGWWVHCITSQKLDIPGVISHYIDPTRDPYEYSRRVAQVVTHIEPDIAECSNWRFELLTYARNKRNDKTKIVVRCDPSATTLFPSAKEFESGEIAMCNIADKLVAVSKFAAKDISSKYSIGKIQVIYNGVESVDLAGVDKQYIDSGKIIDSTCNEIIEFNHYKMEQLMGNGVNVFWMGKTTRMKGFDLLERVVSSSPASIRFIICLGHSIPEVVWNDKTRENCIFVQDLEKDDLYNIWSSCNLYLSTSRVEGFGLSVMESLMLNVPAILNDGCEVYHEFLPNRNLKLCDIQNVTTLISMMEQCKNVARNTDGVPSKFTSDTMIKKSIKIYNQLLA